ncbi:MAG: hypothetical protein KDG55_09855 [Rhodocyclaceae bacterium]|nr:hypothetical protein [Rhodocyclaceae bacterium]
MPDSPPRARRFRTCLVAFALAALVPARAATISTPDGGTYTGPLLEGRLHGEGRLEWESGAHYSGSFERGQMSGRGLLVLPDGSRHEGMFRNGALNGEGRMSLPDGSVYTGWFRHGFLHGRGHYAGPDGTYEGSFRDGRFSGRGELTLTGGARYRGEFSLGRFEGKGRFESEAGEVFEGEFSADQFTGKGRLSRPDGSRYEGGFINWLAEGPGRFTSPDGIVFEGRFESGEVTGPARIRYPDGAVYEGGVEAWLPEGDGVMQFANGDRYEGQFASGQLDGKGVMRLATPRDGLSRLDGPWVQGRLVDPAAERAQLESAESLLYEEPDRLRQRISGLKPGDPDTLDMYLLTVAGDGAQEVFRRETAFVRKQFEARFATGGRALGLTNTRTVPLADPVATRTGIRRAIEGIAAAMNRDQDILFLYLSSHGSPAPALSLAQPAFDLPDLEAGELARVLRESGIRWRVIVVSACYSGGFIDALRDPGTLLITAARHDRRSFGCADENDFTYFGRAFFQDALPQSASFQEAFARAQKLIRERELALLERSGPVEEQDFSLPQIDAPAPITRHLARWWATLPRPAVARSTDR